MHKYLISKLSVVIDFFLYHITRLEVRYSTMTFHLNVVNGAVIQQRQRRVVLNKHL